MLQRRTLLAASAAAAALPMVRARAEEPGLKIGVLTDLSGTYKDAGGTQAIAAAHQAVEDYGAAAKGMKVEIVSADHQNKPDVGAGIARQWFDQDGVDLIVEVANSGVALAVAGVAKDKNKVYMNSGAASSDLTGSQCNANTIHFSYDTYMLAKSTGGAIVKNGGKSWFFITADYAFGKALQRDTTSFIEAAGGKVLGSVAYPFPGTSDFSSFLLQAQSSGADVIGFANAGADTVNSIKQTREFGLTQTRAALLTFISDVHAIGLDTAQGLELTNSFYWDANERTRAFANRLQPKAPGLRPGMVHAGVYASSLHYMKVASAMGIAQAKADGAATVAALKRMPTDDDCFGAGSIRADGRCIHPSYLWKVKSPAESKGPWDYYKLVATTPADEAFRPLDKGGCPLVKSLMDVSRRAMLGSAAALAVPARARAAPRPSVKVGVLNDQSGPYRDTGGQTSVACARQAVADFGSATRPFDVEVVFADHQNKPDVGAGVARQWFDQDGVDMIVDVPNSAVALAVQSVAREKNKVYVNSGAGSDVLTGAQCSPNLVHWTYDTWLLARSIGGAMVKAGGDSWYFITANYAFGQQLQRETSELVAASGGKVLGAALYPFPETADFSSYMVQAASSGAKVLGLCNAGGDTVNSIKQAHEFGVAQQMRIAAMLMFIGDVHALTLEVAQGLVLTETFYWDLNERTRAFTKRILPQTPTNYPNMDHAGVYAGTLHWLKAVAAMGAAAAKADGRATVARMKATPTDDDCFGRNTIREDGCHLCPAYLFEVKKPADSKGPWDYYSKAAETPGPEAWRPLADGRCEFVKGA